MTINVTKEVTSGNRKTERERDSRPNRNAAEQHADALLHLRAGSSAVLSRSYRDAFVRRWRG